MSKITKVGQQCCIDSMQIRLPLSSVSSYSPSLTENTLHVTPSGEVIAELTNNRKHRVGELGLSLQVKKVRHEKRENIDCLILTAPTKLLGRHYFDGINQDTFRIIYDAIIGSELADVSLDALLTSGVATDFDIKRDSYLPGGMDFVKWCRMLKKQAKPTTDIGKGCKVYNNAKEGKGIQFNCRKTSTMASPFLKFYDKCRELHSNSLDFTKSNLRGHELTGLIRAEATVKNRQQVKRVLRTPDNSLGNILSLPSNELQKFLIHAQRVHLDKITAVREKSNEMKPLTLSVYNLAAHLFDTGMSFREVEKIVVGEGRKKKDKGRTKDLIAELHNHYLSKQKNGSEASYEGFNPIGA